jgi:7-cyano-7-deazaguanine synthase
MTTAIALLSGGLDSGTALALWREGGGGIALALTADYGQRAAVAELRAARALAQRFGVRHECVELPWLGALARRAGSALVAGGGALPQRTPQHPGDAASAAAVWVPARNVVLLAVAAAHAEAHGADCALAGFNREEAATFLDNGAEFVAAMNAALGLGTRNAVEVASPTQDLDKAAIAAAARRLGFARGDFWSCYGAGPAPCEACESCARSAVAWAMT